MTSLPEDYIDTDRIGICQICGCDSELVLDLSSGLFLCWDCIEKGSEEEGSE